MAGATLPLAPDSHSGRTLGKYEILCRLSTGGMSEIFLAFQRGLAGFRKIVVLKSILPDIRGEEEFVRMFLDEAKICAAFNHPNIASVFDLDIDEGELFLAMEFVPGCTLVEVARACRANNEPIPTGFAIAATRDTALALHYAHTFTDPMGQKQVVIHRDVAEKNIMVTYEGVTKLLDFGIAKSLSRANRTMVGMVKGTSGYMSPEQILGEPLDPRSDVFSLGVVLHECLTGMRLFHGKNPEEGMMAALKEEVAPPSRQNRDVPAELDAVVLKALARKREERYGSALEFARAIERAASPLIWHPEQSGELINRLFADRREQTRQLLAQMNEQGQETTNEVKLANLLAGAGNPATPRRGSPSPALATPRQLDSMGGKPAPSPNADRAVVPSPVSPLPAPRVSGRQAALQRPGMSEPSITDAPTPQRPIETVSSADIMLTTDPGLTPADKAKGPPGVRRDLATVPGRPGPNSASTNNDVITAPPHQPPMVKGGAANAALPYDYEDDDDDDPMSRTIPAAELPEGLFPRELTGPTPSTPAQTTDDREDTSDDSRDDVGTVAMRKNPIQVLDSQEDSRDDYTPSDGATMVGGVHEGTDVSEVTRKRGGATTALSVIIGGALAIGIFLVGAYLLGLNKHLPFLRGNDGSETTAVKPLLTPDAPGVGEKAPTPSPTPTPPKQETARPETAKAPDAEKKPPEPPRVVEAPPMQLKTDAPAKKADPPPKADPPKQTTQKKRSVTVARAEKKEDKPVEGPGQLTLVASPFAHVFFKGQDLGVTPLFKTTLPSGKHTLKLVGPDNKAYALPVEIREAQTANVRVNLADLQAE